MVKLLKLFGKGIVTTLLLPVLLVVWCGYSVYCLTTFIVMFFVNIIEYFRGENLGGELIEDLESRKLILEKEKADEETKQMVNVMYQNALAQAAIHHMSNSQGPVNPIPPYGMDNFSAPQEQETISEIPSIEGPDLHNNEQQNVENPSEFSQELGENSFQGTQNEDVEEGVSEYDSDNTSEDVR